MPEYTPEQLWPLYEKLPEDLKEAIFSEKTAENLSAICSRYGVEEEKISEIAKYTGYVLLGVLAPDDFEGSLRKEVGLKNELAKRVAWEISRLIFFPVKESLEMIYKIEIAPGFKPPTGVPPEKPKDIYREPIE